MKTILFFLLSTIILLVSCGEDFLNPSNTEEENKSTTIAYITNFVVTNNFFTNYVVVTNNLFYTTNVYTTNFVIVTNNVATNYVYTTNYLYYTNSYDSSFKVYWQGGNVTTPSKIYFSNEIWDLGNEFNNGSFTPANPGIYLLTGVIKTLENDWGILVKKNNTEVIYSNYISVYSTDDKIPFEFTIIEISEIGDTYDVWVIDNGSCAVGENSFFSGIRLQ